MNAPARILVLPLLLPLMLLVAGCDDDDDEPSGTFTPEPTAIRTPSPAPETPMEEPFGDGSITPVSATPAPGASAALLVDVRTGEHVDYDRITFEFESGLPGYSVQYVTPPIIADASGEEVEIDGGAFIQVRMEPSAGHDPDTGEETYDGDLELTPGLPSLVEAERTGDFEGVLTWVLGVREEELEFRVTALEDPGRLVIDVRHPGP